MSANPRAYLKFSIDVDCPECKQPFDLCSEVNDWDNRITDLIFTNQWQDTKDMQVQCTHCEFEFEIFQVVY